jgi:hypothetical protein
MMMEVENRLRYFLLLPGRPILDCNRNCGLYSISQFPDMLIGGTVEYFLLADNNTMANDEENNAWRVTT